MKALYAVILLALASVAPMACGSDEATTAKRQSTVVIEVGPIGNDFAYKTDRVRAAAGDVKIVLRNPQFKVKHDVRVEDVDGNQLGGTDVITEGADSVRLVDLEPGGYAFYCSVPGHRTAGMEGTLTVE